MRYSYINEYLGLELWQCISATVYIVHLFEEFLHFTWLVFADFDVFQVNITAIFRTFAYLLSRFFGVHLWPIYTICIISKLIFMLACHFLYTDSFLALDVVFVWNFYYMNRWIKVSVDKLVLTRRLSNRTLPSVLGFLRSFHGRGFRVREVIFGLGFIIYNIHLCIDLIKYIKRYYNMSRENVITTNSLYSRAKPVSTIWNRSSTNISIPILIQFASNYFRCTW